MNSLFMSTFSFLGVVSLIVAAAGIALRNELSTILGARGAVHEMLSDYIAGYMPGIPAQALYAMLMALVSFNNDMRRSYVSAAVLAVTNGVGDLLFSVFGTFGLGLATTVSSLLALLILLPGYFRKDRAIHFAKFRPDGGAVLEAAGCGAPSLLFTVGVLIKNSLLNYALSTCAGSSGVAVANVMVSVCGILGIFAGGHANAYRTLAGLYYGEQDRDSFTGLFKIAFRIGETGFLIMTAAIILSSSFLSGLFFPPGTETWEMGKQMIILAFLFYPFNMFKNCLQTSRHFQNRMTMVNIMSLVGTAMNGIVAVLTVPRFGIAAAWLANTWVDLVGTAVIIGCEWIIKKRADLKLPTLLGLSDSFGALPDEFREYSVKSIGDVMEASESVVHFCKERGVSPRTAIFAGVCVEEMAKNIIQHGARPGKNTDTNIRIVVQEELTIRIRDNCPEFDPRKRMELFNPDSRERNIGIRLMAGLARQVDYYNNAGINTLPMKI